MSTDKPEVSGCPEARRTRSAWFACKKQELLAPAGAIIDLTETLLKDARDLGHEEFLGDLDKIYTAGKNFLGMIHDVLDPDRREGGEEELARRIRHDLRTPLGQVLGYCEIWLEDAPDQLLERFVPDLTEIRTLSQQLLAAVDDLLGFTKTLADAEHNPELPGLPEMIRNLVSSIGKHAAEDGASIAAGTGSILVVDDNEINRDLLSRRLIREGHTVTVACDGRQALDLVRARKFDLILLDIIMPGLNGFQVLEQLKADEELRYIPVIMISAFNELDGVVHCIEMGAEDYLPKPFNPVLLKARIGACLEKKRLRDREVVHLERIKEEQKRSDDLLHVILPAEIVRELKATNAVKPRRYENVAVMFCDIVDFTPYCDGHPPEYVVSSLQQLTEIWEEIAVRYQVEKIKTIGDAFMAAAGLLQKPVEGSVLSCVRCGLDMIAATQQLPTQWNLRVGIHVGPVVAGVVGRRQYLFDLWGDTVNTAARMESHGVPGAVTLSGTAWQQIAQCSRGESRGIITVKGKGAMEMFRFDGFTS